jgi:addiction module HigA family antidote
MTKKDFAPLHPGVVLLEEFVKPLGLSQHRLALSMRVPPQKINDIVRGKRGITADTALRLSIVLGTSAEFWMGLQSDYDLETTLDALGDRLQKEITPINA